ncbi:hypothetical protein GFJ94_10345 [Flavobacterium sp. LMO8]|uniref:hypothetical protein n=1 Tax=Flavobacterium sp. LMO8 TaxID=2654244 RepID=UPI001291742F|nr:hypothetical protein [Flavobacterium sp. LMO8]MQP25464.1 hypothetical protein [Flavobacterium sp. LMO8]
MKKYIILLVIIYFGFTQKNNAQVQRYESEAIFLHTNETTFVTGETLLFKIYCLNANSKELSTISKIAYIEIKDPNGKTLSRNKITLNNGIGANEIFINTTFNTGNYKLIAYTNWMLNNSNSKYFETNIAIINPFLPFKNKENNKQDTTLEIVKSDDANIKNDEVTIKLVKNNFSKREKVLFDVVSNSEKFTNGNYSISVRRIDGLTFGDNISSKDFFNNHSDKFIYSNSIKHLPELRGELLSGKLTTNDSSKTTKDKHLGLSAIGEPFDFKIVKTNNNGEFYFILDKEQKKSDVVLQVLENEINDFQITIDPPAKVEVNTTFKNNLNFSETSIKDVEARLVACQIVNAYSTKDSLAITSKNFIPFYNNNATDYILDDYKRFSTFKETIIEIVPAVFFKENEGDYSLHIRDYVTAGESFGSALVLVDGMLLQDVNELFNYNTKNIYKISVVNKAYAYGSKIFSGLISITTFDREYNPKSKNILPIQIERSNLDKAYHSTNYETEKDFSRLPDFRYQLAWNTIVSLSKNTTPFHFFTSDIEGKYEISLEGFSAKGEPLSIKEYFEVN